MHSIHGKISRMLNISEKQNIAVIEGHSLDVQLFDILQTNGYKITTSNKTERLLNI